MVSTMVKPCVAFVVVVTMCRDRNIDGCFSERRKSPSTPNRSRTYDVGITSPDALSLSYKILNGAI